MDQDDNDGNVQDSNTHLNTSVLFVQNLIPLAKEIADFSEARDWLQYHTPRNLVLALLGEVGELAELVQFKGDTTPSRFTEEELDKLGQELADVTIYLLRLTFVCQLVEAVQTSLQESDLYLSSFGAETRYNK
jgi:dCTP diphosphatase